jgi:hypothetical protein
MTKRTISVNAQAYAVITKADALAVKREQFEQNEYARSNKRLYEILGEVMAMYEEANESKTVLAETVKQLKANLQAKNVRVQNNTLAITLFVRYVFGTDRQRSMNYSRTLQAAIQQNIGADKLAVFIEECGGVEACKKKFTKSEKVIAKEATIADNIELVNEALAEAEKKPLATFNVPKEFVADIYNEDFIFVLAKANKQGNIKVLSAVPKYSTGMGNWARQQMALFISEQHVTSDKSAKAEFKGKAIETAKNKAKNKTPTETVGELLAA